LRYCAGLLLLTQKKTENKCYANIISHERKQNFCRAKISGGGGGGEKKEKRGEKKRKKKKKKKKKMM